MPHALPGHRARDDLVEQLGAELLEVEAQVARGLEGALRVAHIAPRHHASHLGPEVRGELLRQAEVDQAHHAVGEHEQVPRVRVAVEEASLEDHRGVEGGHPLGERAQVHTTGPQTLEVGQRQAVQVLGDEQLARAVLGVDARHADAVIALESFAQPLGGLGLALEVELELDEVSHLVEQRRSVDHG